MGSLFLQEKKILENSRSQIFTKIFYQEGSQMDEQRMIILGNLVKEANLVLQERWGIKRAAVYNRMAALEIELKKTSDKQCYLYEEEIQTLDELDSWLKGGNDVYSFKREQEFEKTLAVRQESSLEAVTPEIQFSNTNGHTTASDLLVDSAQKKAAAILLAEQFLTEYFIDNTDKLPDSLQQQVIEGERRLSPKSVEPMEYAILLTQSTIKGMEIMEMEKMEMEKMKLENMTLENLENLEIVEPTEIMPGSEMSMEMEPEITEKEN
jgi:hypothetical protein